MFPRLDATTSVFPVADGVGGLFMGIRITSWPFSTATIIFSNSVSGFDSRQSCSLAKILQFEQRLSSPVADNSQIFPLSAARGSGYIVSACPAKLRGMQGFHKLEKISNAIKKSAPVRRVRCRVRSGCRSGTVRNRSGRRAESHTGPVAGPVSRAGGRCPPILCGEVPKVPEFFQNQLQYTVIDI